MKVASTMAKVAVLAVAVAAPAVALSPSASAIGGNCSSGMERQDNTWTDDVYRAWASCSSLQADSKARAVLDRTGLDKYSSYFTRLNTRVYTGWYVWGNGHAVEIARI